MLIRSVLALLLLGFTTLAARANITHIVLIWLPESAPQNTAQAITVSLHCENNYPARKAVSDWDIPLPRGMGDAEYLQVVDDTLNYLLALYQPDIVLYDAGVDVHQNDALGYLNLSDAGIAALSATQAAAQDSALRYSRGNEQEADRVGMQTIADAGFNRIPVAALVGP